MTGWKLTATTILCRHIGDEVTLMMTEDGTLSCTCMQRYYSNGRSSGRKHCQGPSCALLAEYKSKLAGENVRSSR